MEAGLYLPKRGGGGVADGRFSCPYDESSGVIDCASKFIPAVRLGDRYRQFAVRIGIGGDPGGCGVLAADSILASAAAAFAAGKRDWAGPGDTRRAD